MASTLDGITALDLTTGAAGALATMFLSDHGARVVRLVSDTSTLHRDGGFIIWDRGKECATLDLGAASKPGTAAAATFERLVRGADILVEDFAPSAPLQALVAHEKLRALNRRLVCCSITAFGKVGPLKDEPPIDDLVLAKAGVLAGMPGFRPAPVHTVHPLPSVGAAMLALNGIAASLLARETTGRGRAVTTSLMSGALLYHPKVIGERLTRHVFQTHPSGSAPFYSNYQCADGNWVQLGCVHVNFIAIAAGLFGIGELIKEPRFDKGRGGKTPEDDRELRATIARVIKTKPLSTWAAEFETADVPFAPCQDSEQGLSDPQVLHNRMVAELDDPAVGPVTQMGVPVRFSATPGRIKGPRAAKAVPAESLQLTSPATSPDATSSASSASSGTDAPPLAGVRILEITNLIAGPTAGRILADLGADVIKLEPPEGDMSRPIGRTYFYSVNFNKRSISVDTRQAAGKEIVQKIAASADAMLANLRPGATARMGINAKVNPRLIETHLTGYGLTGPYSKRPGIDPLAQAYMGLQRAQGGPENPPVFPAQLAPTDYTNGAMGAFGTILALYARQRTGAVQTVDSDLLGGGVVLSSAWFSRYRGKPVRPLADRGQYGLSPFHRLYKLADGWIYVAARSAREEAATVEIAGVSEGRLESALAGTHPNATPIADALGRAFETRQLAPTLAALKSAGVAAIACEKGDSEVFLDDPHSLANDMVAVRQHPIGGEIKVAWQWVQFADTSPSQGRPTPLLGEHSADVLREVGYSDDAISALRRDGTIKIEGA